MWLKETRKSILYALEPANSKPTFEWLTCTSRRYTFFYLALMMLFINQLHWVIATFFVDTRIWNILPMYSLFIITVFCFFLTCALYILNLDNIQDKLTASLKWLLQKIRKLDPHTPWDKIVMQGLHCDDELQDIIKALNTKSSQIQNHIEYLEKLIWFIQHEFNTPLAITHLHLERLKKKWLVEDSEFIGIEEELNHMRSLVDTLVWLIKTKTEDFKIEKVSLSWVIYNVSERLETLHPAALFDIHIVDKIELKTNEQYVWAICRNICENALKHWSDKVKITLNKTQLIIHDNGEWIDEETLKKIWLPFWKKTPRNWKQEWFGLGLSLVKILVEKLAREVQVKSGKSWGTTFIFDHS